MAIGNTELKDEAPVQKNTAKKPYTKPAFRFERVFETAALSCGKNQPSEFLCRQNRKIS